MARPKAHPQWTVLPHRPIERLSERLWRVEGTLPNMPLARVMAVARRSGGGLVVHSAIALEDAAIAEREVAATLSRAAHPDRPAAAPCAMRGSVHAPARPVTVGLPRRTQ